MPNKRRRAQTTHSDRPIRTASAHPDNPETTGAAAARQGSITHSAPNWAVAVGAVLAAISGVMSLLLVLERLWGMSLPGCGGGGPCAEAAKSVFGAIRLRQGAIEWPVSYLGLAYFLGALLAWALRGGAVSRVFVYLVRFGALVSAGFCVIILFKHLPCPYCLVAHAANFGFWLTVEFAAVRLPNHRGIGTVIVTFLFASVALGTVDILVKGKTTRAAESAAAESTREIIKQSHAPLSGEPGRAIASTAQAAVPAATSQAAHSVAQNPPPRAPQTPATAAVEPPSPLGKATAGGPASAAAPAGPGFTGRWRVGPEDAPLRIVLFTDYQCPDCKSVEAQLGGILAERAARNDISVSIRYFPFNSDCNRFAPNKTNHPNACWAARAAEAAGMLWGADGFWKMHAWLFDHDGRFETQAELENGVRALGYEPGNFVQIMTGPETLQHVQEDCEVGGGLGLYFTPMIFINGVEFKGWTARGALRKAVFDIAATDPPRRLPLYDRPPAALQKYLEDWRDWNGGRPIEMPPVRQEWTLGTSGAPAPGAAAPPLGGPALRIVMWGDYQEPLTQKADGIIRAFVAGRNDVTYSYRQYPFNSDCNPNLRDRRFPQSCVAARAAEAAGQVGGNEAFWKMHAWLMENPTRIREETLPAAAAEVGLDTAAFAAALADPNTAGAIADDIEAGKKLPVLRHGMPAGLHGIPSIFLNGRYVPRWVLNEQPILQDILNVALSAPPAQSPATHTPTPAPPRDRQ